MKRRRKRSSITFMASKKATKIDKIFTVDLTLCSKCQIYVEDFADWTLVHEMSRYLENVTTIHELKIKGILQ